MARCVDSGASGATGVAAVLYVKILVSNDDGYLARGINALAEALSTVADVVVVAPDRNYSGASNSLTLHSPLRIHEVAEDRYFVTGTPSDCVHLAPLGFSQRGSGSGCVGASTTAQTSGTM